MFFIVNYGLVSLLLHLKKIGKGYNNACKYFLLTLLALPCAMQYNVGTDYYGYIEIIKENDVHYELLLDKSEILFAALTRVIYKIGEQYSHLLFVIVGIIYSILTLKILESLRIKNYNLFLVFLIFWTTTGVLHNQLSALRNYIAVYIVIYAILSVGEAKIYKYTFTILLASLFHQTALFFLPLYLIKNITKYNINLKLLFIISFLFFVSGFPLYILELIISFIVPEYGRYITGEAFASENELQIINIITKIIYLPIYLYVVYIMGDEYRKKISNSRNMMLSISILFSFSWALIPYGGYFFRFYHYVVFFQIFTIYEALIYSRKNHKIIFILICGILVAPYIVKTLIFPSNEYQYNSILSKWLL